MDWTDLGAMEQVAFVPSIGSIRLYYTYATTKEPLRYEMTSVYLRISGGCFTDQTRRVGHDLMRHKYVIYNIVLDLVLKPAHNFVV